MRTNRLRERRKYISHSLALAALLWLGLSMGGNGTPLPQTAAQADTPVQYRTAAYVYDRPGLILADEDAARLDQLNYSFALIRDGAVTGDHWQSIQVFQAYVDKHPHILPVLSIGGWGADGFSQAAATEEGRARFVESTLSLMQQYGFRGVDIDWEYPGSSAAGIASSTKDREHYTLLLRSLKEGLSQLEKQDGIPRMLAIALGADPSLLRQIDGVSVGAVVDQVNLMTYDLQTPKVASHHAPLYSADDRYPLSAHSAMEQFAAAGFPRSKLMLGTAFYARIYNLRRQTDSPVFAQARDNGAKTLTYRALMTADGWSHFFDAQAKAPYAINGQRFATYDNTVSIMHKGAYVKENGLMGLMCWEYGGDLEGELLRAMRNSLEE